MYFVKENGICNVTIFQAKQCALIAVDEIIKVVPFYDYNIKNKFNECEHEPDDRFITFWSEVKQEIEKL